MPGPCACLGAQLLDFDPVMPHVKTQVAAPGSKRVRLRDEAERVERTGHRRKPHPRAAIIEEGLRDAGYGQVTVIDQMHGLARRITDLNPDVIVIDLENPNRDELESIFQLSRVIQRPIAMFVDKSDEASIEAAVEAGVSAYIVDGLKQERVRPILKMAISRFNAFSRLNRELEETRSELENRKVIDRAKGLLMRSRGLTEDEAYALLRRTAMNQNRKIVEIAQSLVTAASLLDPGVKE
jgi:response regulator NasT